MDERTEIAAGEVTDTAEEAVDTPQPGKTPDTAESTSDEMGREVREDLNNDALEGDQDVVAGDLPTTAADTTGEAYTEIAARQEQPVHGVDTAAELPALDDDEQTASLIDLFPAGDSTTTTTTAAETEDARKLAVLEAVVYVTDEPLTLQQIAVALQEPVADVKRLLDRLVDEYNRPEHGLTVKEVAGGYKMATKAEHHEAVRAFVKNLNPPLKLSLAALETLAVIAYKQPITAPEIMEIRGVQGAGVLKTLLERKLISTAGRKQVVGKPILYKTTKEFLVQFGLRDLHELPSLKEFEDLRRLAFSETEDDTMEVRTVDGLGIDVSGEPQAGDADANEQESNGDLEETLEPEAVPGSESKDTA